MAIKVGDRVPNGSFTVMTGEGPKPKTTDELFKGKKVVLFAVPGAFTPTCSAKHLPSFKQHAADLKAKGVATPLVEQTLADRYANTNEEALAREHLERKRIRKPENEKETARIMRRLVAAGFSTGVIYKILRQWDVPDEALAALDNMDEEPHEE